MSLRPPKKIKSILIFKISVHDADIVAGGVNDGAAHLFYLSVQQAGLTFNLSPREPDVTK